MFSYINKIDVKAVIGILSAVVVNEPVSPRDARIHQRGRGTHLATDTVLNVATFVPQYGYGT